MAELLPCPFCGGVACQVYSVWGEGYRYGCLTSGCIGNVNNLLKQFKSDKEAIEAWNTRTPQKINHDSLCETETFKVGDVK